jgi:hypothetical protein
MLIQKASCLGCGAPLGLSAGQRVVICAYCNASLQVAPVVAGTDGQAAAVVTNTGVAPEEVERVKQMVLAGQRDAAIAHYAQIAAVPLADATKAVDELVVFALYRLLRQAPINWFGFVLYGVIIGGAGVGAYFSVLGALAGTSWLWALAALCVFVVLWQTRSFVPKVISTAVSAFGTDGRARVLKRTILKAGYHRGGTLLQVLFEVTPARGGASFIDEEALLVRDESVEKLVPGNIVPVRYDEPGRKRVFPTSPITVVGRID